MVIIWVNLSTYDCSYFLICILEHILLVVCDMFIEARVYGNFINLEIYQFSRRCSLEQLYYVGVLV